MYKSFSGTYANEWNYRAIDYMCSGLHDNIKLFPKMIEQIYSPNNSDQVFQLFHILAITWFYWLLKTQIKIKSINISK